MVRTKDATQRSQQSQLVCMRLDVSTENEHRKLVSYLFSRSAKQSQATTHTCRIAMVFALRVSMLHCILTICAVLLQNVNFLSVFLDCYRKQVAHQRLLDGDEIVQYRRSRTTSQNLRRVSKAVCTIRANNRICGSCATSE